MLLALGVTYIVGRVLAYTKSSIGHTLTGLGSVFDWGRHQQCTTIVNLTKYVTIQLNLVVSFAKTVGRDDNINGGGAATH
ncbi:hypothetical protein O9992_04115 [Vibrio lentus]|nr:hypothetical protein [Vibrio lentus]